jgi:poly(3-hydroxyalkanoate) synthetase
MDKSRGFYKPFKNARLEEDLQEWLKEENKKYDSWNMFFQELKRRYESGSVIEVNL